MCARSFWGSLGKYQNRLLSLNAHGGGLDNGAKVDPGRRSPLRMRVAIQKKRFAKASEVWQSWFS